MDTEMRTHLVGLLLGTAIKIAIVFTMIGVFLVALVL